MPTLKYVGPSHFRRLSAADLASEGVETDGDIFVARDGIFREHNPERVAQTVEVSDQVAEYLLRYEKGDWKTLTPKQEEKLQESTDADNAPDDASGAQEAGKKAAKKS